MLPRRGILNPRDAVLVLIGAAVTYTLTSYHDLLSTKSTSAREPLPFHVPSAGDPAQRQHYLATGATQDDDLALSESAHKQSAQWQQQNPSARTLFPSQWIQPVPPSSAIKFPTTQLLHHAPGWSYFSDLYMADDTFYVVLPSLQLVQEAKKQQNGWPSLRMMISPPLWAYNEKENIKAREPTEGKELKFIDKSEAERLWGTHGERVLVVEGNTVLANEPSQFLNHYYHVIAEFLLGTWVFWTGCHANGGATETLPPPIHRLIFARTPSAWDFHKVRTHEDAWHDKPGMNALLLHGVFPSMSIEDEEDWNDRIAITKGAARAFRFQSLLLSDRSAAHRGYWTGEQNQRIASEAWEYVNAKNLIPTFSLQQGKWWKPVREAVWRFAGVERIADSERKQKVITYWSRQLSRSRKLRTEDHERLVSELTALANRRGWIFQHVDAEKIPKDEQIRIIADTDIFLGVHGNGLSHLIWLPKTKISTVVEIFYPEGFAHDYQWTSQALGHGYAAVWNDTHQSHLPKMWPNYAPGHNNDGGFQGDHIPVHAPHVAELIEKRIDGELNLNL